MRSDKGPSVSALRVLLVVAEKGGVTAAAEELGMTQPTLSRWLKVFHRESADGLPVLHRQGKRLRLTEKGRAALPSIRELLCQYDWLIDYLDGRRRHPAVVRIGLGGFSAEAYLPQVLATIRQQEVAFEIATRVVRGRERVVGIAGGHFDLAVVTHDPMQVETMVAGSPSRDTKLEIERLSSLPFCAIASMTSAAGRGLEDMPRGRTISLEVLAKWDLVGLDRQSGIRLKIERQARLQSLRLRFNEAAGVGGWAAAKAYAREGLGVAIVPLTTIVLGDQRELAIRRLPAEFSLDHYLIHRQKPLTPPQKKVKRALKKAAQDYDTRVRQLWRQQT